MTFLAFAGNDSSEVFCIYSLASFWARLSSVEILYTLTNSMELNTTQEATSCEATHEIPSISWNPKVHYGFHKIPLLHPILI
jgi:hypothetical protein